MEPQTNPDGTYSFDYAVYVDNSEMAMINSEPTGINNMVASSLEYDFILGYPGPIEAPYVTPTMAADKMDEVITTSTMILLG
jgi:hypothetical protein